MPCTREFDCFRVGDSLGWVGFKLNIIQSKYVGCDCVECLGVTYRGTMFVDSYYGGVLVF